MSEFFADTYAILAGLDGDARYVARLKAGPFRTSHLNLYEALYAQLARGIAADEAHARLAPFEANASAIDWPTLRKAAALRRRLQTEGRRCSYIDAAGYAQALELGLPFLTGDPAFKGLSGVDFLVESARRKR